MVARKSANSSKQTTSRHVWLAALGVAAIVRREAFTAAQIALDELIKFRRNAVQFADDAGDVARGAAMTVLEAVDSRIEPRVGRFSAEVEARLAPVLEKLGVSAAGATQRRPRKAARKPRKPTAKKATRRTASGRKQAAARVARKGRG